MPAIELRHVKKSYGQYQALKDLSFTVKQGTIVGLLGPNGAGKSTTLDIILGLKDFDSGTVNVLGHSAGSKEVKKIMTCIPQELAFPTHLKVSEVVRVVASIYQVPIDEKLLAQFQIEKFQNKLAGVLSGGQKRRLSLALAFMPKPKIVIMDEPTTGLDVEAKAEMWRLLEEYRKQGGTLLMTSHDLYELTQLADEVVLVDQGQALFQGDSREMLRRCQFKKVTFSCRDKDFASDLIVKKVVKGDEWVCWTKDSDNLVRQLISKNIDFENLHIETGDLHEIFNLLRG